MIQQHIVAIGVPAIIIDKEQRILLVKRSGRSHSGMWGIPTETLQPGETVIQALKRGMKEELGVDISIIRFTGYFYDTPGRDVRYQTAIDLPHICKVLHGEPTPQEECMNVRWFSRQELSRVVFPYDQRKMLQDARLVDID
jgi:8-oxo-dGTP diphosphatase